MSDDEPTLPQPDKGYSAFEARCRCDPQGVIKDLIGQTSRQAAEINRLATLTEGILEPKEAQHLLHLLTHQPVQISRDFYQEELDEKLAKKLKVLAEPPKVTKEKKEKKKKGVPDATAPVD